MSCGGSEFWEAPDLLSLLYPFVHSEVVHHCPVIGRILAEVGRKGQLLQPRAADLAHQDGASARIVLHYSNWSLDYYYI